MIFVIVALFVMFSSDTTSVRNNGTNHNIVIIVVVIILVELMRVIVGSRSKPFPKTKIWENTKQFGNS